MSSSAFKTDRRKFLGTLAAGAAGLTLLPSGIVSGAGLQKRSPSDKLNIGVVGIGGIGSRTLDLCAIDHNIAALCDVDWSYAAGKFEKYPNAKRYKDYRKMLEEQKDLDAVVIATPDHTHAMITLSAMQLGKHVYTEKPLTHTVSESRVLTEAAVKYKVATQMGNQGSSGEGIAQICEWIWDGVIGEIKEVHAWTNRPIWPQGLERPANGMWVPETLDWELFLGPAPMRPYHEVYTPWNWRAWWDFGTGALGDMACHILDPVFKGLMLQYPSKVESSSTQVNTESAPRASVVRYTFPARQDQKKLKMPEVVVNWYDGGLLPPRPAELEPGTVLGNDNNGGVIFVGTKGKIMCGCYAKDPVLLPKSLADSYKNPAKTIKRVEFAGVEAKDVAKLHVFDWLRACRENADTRVLAKSDFKFSGPLNEMVVMGNLAVRLQSLNKPLEWDGKNMKITNISDTEKIKVVSSDKFTVVNGHPHFDTKHDELNAKQAAEEYIKHKYRQGWFMEGLSR